MSAVMKLKTLQGHLNQLSGFSNPKIQLEQYETPPHIAASVLWTIQTQFEDIEGRSVLDAGCGPGALGGAAALLGAARVLCLDVDAEALRVLRENVRAAELTSVDAVQADFLRCDLDRWGNYFDTVIMNPPFGTKNNAGMDMKFLRMGTHITSNAVYSLHKTSTRAHIKSKVKEWGMKGDVLAQLRYDLSATYKFHKKNSRDIDVDLWRVSHIH